MYNVNTLFNKILLEDNIKKSIIKIIIDNKISLNELKYDFINIFEQNINKKNKFGIKKELQFISLINFEEILDIYIDQKHDNLNYILEKYFDFQNYKNETLFEQKNLILSLSIEEKNKIRKNILESLLEDYENEELDEDTIDKSFIETNNEELNYFLNNKLKSLFEEITKYKFNNKIIKNEDIVEIRKLVENDKINEVSEIIEKNHYNIDNIFLKLSFEDQEHLLNLLDNILGKIYDNNKKSKNNLNI